MSVRKTERKLPGGIANANAFGFAAINAEENVALISHLEKTLVYQHSDKPNENKPILNTYTVFADDTFLNTHAGPNETADDVALEITYGWKFQLLDADKNVLSTEVSNSLLEETYERTSRGIMHINSIQMEDDLYYTSNSDRYLWWEAWLILHTDWERAAFFKMSVELYKGFSSTTPLTELHLIHQVRGTAKIIEYLKSTHDGNNPGAYLGREPVTRMVANDYMFYLLHAKEHSYLFNGTTISRVLSTPSNVMAGLMYQNAIQGVMEPRFGGNDYYEGILNLNDELNPDPFILDGEPLSEKLGLFKSSPISWRCFYPKMKIGQLTLLFNELEKMTSPKKNYSTILLSSHQRSILIFSITCAFPKQIFKVQPSFYTN